MNNKPDYLDLYIKHKDINFRTKEIAKNINSKFIDSVPIIIGVLNGSFLFVADLVRELNIDFEIDFIKLSSYGSEMKSKGTVILIKDISANLADRDVIVVEDIIDTGLTVKFLENRLNDAGAKSVTIVSCLVKDNISKDFDLNYIGFKITNKFVVGYGLDLNQKYRGLKSIYTINKEKMNVKK